MEVSVAKICNCKNENYFMYVSSNHKINYINYISLDCKRIRLKYEYDGSNTNDYQFIKSEIKKILQKQSGKLKGVIFDLFGSNPTTKRYNLRVFWKIFCDEIGVPYQFINTSTLKVTSILFGAKKKLRNTSNFEGFKETVSVNFSSSSCLETMETHDLSEFEGSYIRLSLSINANGFHNFNIQKLEHSFSLLQQSIEDYAYVQMHLNNENIEIGAVFGGYRMENNSFDKPSYICFFNDGFPVVGKAAKKLALQHPSFVVYDILNLTKMANEGNIKINPKWGFKVEKDSNGILQIIFDTWRGKRKATPQFLLAILINCSLNAAKEFVGFRPTVFNIHIYDDFKSAEKAVIQAFKILDVQYFVKSVPEKKFILVEKKIL